MCCRYRHLRGLWLLALLLAGAGSQQYAETGPCGVARTALTLQLPEESECGSECTLDLQLHLPDARDRPGCPPPPHAAVVFYSGFQLTSQLYRPYAHRLASWGLGVAQYDQALFHITADRIEVGYLAHILRRLRREVEDTSSPLHGSLDLTRLAAAGHSRGAKLAALQLAAGNVLAAFLIDPVDSTSFSPPSRDEPSAVAALRGQRRLAGIAAAGVGGPCNPSDANFAHFYDVLAPGSWLETVVHAGHMQFTSISSSVVQRAFDLLCHRGSDDHQTAIQLAAAPMTAWLSHSLRQAGRGTQLPGSFPAVHALPGVPGGQLGRGPAAATQAGGSGAAPRSLQPFLEWVANQTAAGEIMFQIKPAAGSADAAGEAGGGAGEGELASQLEPTV